jgi:hypothetical protein
MNYLYGVMDGEPRTFLNLQDLIVLVWNLV